MIRTTMSADRDFSDSELVALSVAGNQESFAQIVSRYQSLICALTYSACGNVSRSEDLAQETFIIAWKELRNLRTPERLRSWLCAIARNRIHNAFRKEQREPVFNAASLEDVTDSAGPELPPSSQAITEEEQNILWRSLERIPDTYREPLVLYYREHRSVAEVAKTLELSEDAVEKRLTRGRKMLQEEVAAFVETALERTTPGKAFTMSVLAALPLFAASSATAASVGVVKAGTAAKAATAVGLTAAAWGPLLGLIGPVVGAWSSIRNTHSPRERRFMIRQTIIVFAFAALFVAALVGLKFYGKPLARYSRVAFGCFVGGMVLLYVAGLTFLIFRGNRRQRQIRIEDGTEQLVVEEQRRRAARPIAKWEVIPASLSMGGGLFGSTAWMIIQTARLQQWVTLSVIIAFDLVVTIVSTRALLRHPEKRKRILLTNLALLGTFIVVVALLNWRKWTYGF